MRRLDIVALVFGVLLTGTALVSLWLSFVGNVDWQVIRVVAPLSLVAVGIVGLALSRNRE